MTIKIDFGYGGHAGRVSVSCVPNDDPVALGKSPADRGMPACTATVDFAGRGYWALMGWVQLVSDGSAAEAGFESDPFELFEDSTSPYCWYGSAPTLFDAPSRRDARPMIWAAQSFLAVTPWDQDERLIVPLAAFGWGYRVDENGMIGLDPVTRLTGADWDGHTGYLTRRYPTWAFGDAHGLVPSNDLGLGFQ